MLRRYWIFTSLILVAVIAAWYQGVFAWGLQKFPDRTVHLIVSGIGAVLLWSYLGSGLRSARIITTAECISDIPEEWGENPISSILYHTIDLRAAGERSGQSNYAPLMDLASERLDDELFGEVHRIDSARVFLFFFGLLVTLIGIVAGFATQQFPSNPEEAKMFSFTIIKALGLAYLPAMMCIGSTLVLYVLSTMLQHAANAASLRLQEILYRITILGEHCRGQPSSS